jgi:hypothetical protein
MTAYKIACPGCSLPVPEEFWNREEGVRCRGCGQPVRVLVFPAIEAAPAGAAPAALGAETEASCFYHPESRAAQVCQDCGRFLCNLCDLEIDGRHICPRCFESTEKPEPRRTMYDAVALALSTLPMFMVWPALVTAPWALFLVIRRWNTPLSLVPRTKIRFVLAGLFALAEIAFFVFLIYFFYIGIRAGRATVHAVPKV